MTLGQRIQGYRLRLELSQEALGERLGVSRQAVSKWEADGAVPDTDKLIALSKLFGITLNELLQVESPAAENGETPPAPEQEQGEEAGGRRKARLLRVMIPVLCVAALLLNITALGVTFGRKTGQLSDRIARLEKRLSLLETAAASLDPGELVVDWELGSGDELYTRNGLFYRNVPVTVALVRSDPEQTPEVFFQVYGNGLTTEEVAAQPQGTGVYSAQIPIRQGNFGTLAVGFRLDGAEYLQPLADITSLSDHSIQYTPLLERP